MIVPTDFKQYIPRIYWGDERSDVLATKAGDNILEWTQDVCGIGSFFDPARCPEEFLGELGYMLNAGLADDDSETIARQKIATAVQGHKRRGSWAFDAKTKVDAIAGGDSSLTDQGGSAGQIYIDVDNDSLTQDQIDKIVQSLTDVVPSYYEVYIGHTAGGWTQYAVMG